MVAYVSGVAVGEANDPAWVALEACSTCFHPTGSTTCSKPNSQPLNAVLRRGNPGEQPSCGRSFLGWPCIAEWNGLYLRESTNAS